MKKLFFATITAAAALLSFEAKAQWTTTGSNIYNSNASNVGIGTGATIFNSKLHLTGGSVLFNGTTGATPTTNTSAQLGGGTRMMWIPAKAAFRAGSVSSTRWDDANIGNYSVAMGSDNQASGLAAIALGLNNVVVGGYSTALGTNNITAGTYSTSIGNLVQANGSTSMALGHLVKANASLSHVIGAGILDEEDTYVVNNISNSLMVGYNSDLPTLFVGPSNGIGTTGTVAVGTTTIPGVGPAGGYKFVTAGNSNVNGSLVIGNPSNFTTGFPSTYQLFVSGGIITEKMKVALKTSANWADFVFDKSYKLMPLAQVEKFIDKNKHLPDVPSADQMVENGLDVVAMDAKLLQKIEELTLYMIELKKENEKLINDTEELKKEVSILKKKN